MNLYNFLIVLQNVLLFVNPSKLSENKFQQNYVGYSYEINSICTTKNATNYVVINKEMHLTVEMH